MKSLLPWSLGLALASCVSPASAEAPQARDPALPASAPDFRGVTAENFFRSIEALDPQPASDPPLPALDPSKATVVDPEGVGGKPGDENPGTVERPFATLGRALKDLKPGAIILLRKGTHRIPETIVLDGKNGQTGTEERPAVVASFPGEVATVTGATPVAAWAATANPAIYESLLAFPAGRRSALWWDGRLLPSLERHLHLASTNSSMSLKGAAAAEGPVPLTVPGTWAVDATRLLLRPPGDADARLGKVEFATDQPTAAASIEITASEWIVFHRVAFVRHLQAARSIAGRYVVFRHCLFQDCLYGLTFHSEGGEPRGIVDGCMFERVGGPAGGASIYTTAGITVRNSLFRDVGPQLAVEAYTSKNDMFSGLKVVGNTFLRAGACITSTGKDSLVRDNVALASRFLSSAGSNARIEGNIAVYDPSDMGRFPNIPRRDIGFRMYGVNALVCSNSLVGFEQGGALVAHKGEKTTVRFLGNRVSGYREFGLRAASLEGVTLDGNTWVPSASTNRVAIYLKSEEGVRELLSLQDLQARGAEVHGRFGGTPPQVPLILREALEVPPGKP